MGYTLDIKKIPIEKYQSIIKKQDLLPGRRLLLTDIDHRFEKIAAAGVASVHDLKNSLSTPSRLSSFSQKTGIPEDYLVILKRELSSLEQKPVPLSAFPGIGADSIARLEAAGLKSSKDFFDKVAEGGMSSVCEATGLNESIVAEFSALCNLVRINGVGPAAAKTFCESGYTSIAHVAGADAGTLLERVQAVNDDKRYYQAKLGLNDMQFVIDGANLILDIEARRI